MSSYTYYPLSRKPKPVGGSGEVVDSEVNSYNLAVMLWRWPRNLAGEDDVDIEQPFPLEKDSELGLLPSEATLLVIPDGKRDLKPALHRGKGNHSFGFYEAENPLIVCCRRRLKPLNLVPLSFISIGRSTNGLNRQVRGEAKSILKLIVANPLEFEFVSRLKLFSILKDEVASSGKGLESGLKRCNLLRRGIEFANYCPGSLHADLIVSLLKGGV